MLCIARLAADFSTFLMKDRFKIVRRVDVERIAVAASLPREHARKSDDAASYGEAT